uniref:Uncharacterized protein n=1 Tax=Trichobilharzia regenti TaxID=157069 RepID=A0AA85J0Z2_TRIRE|nr:unnamed protein product [Trichobilharzia regenti]
MSFFFYIMFLPSSESAGLLKWFCSLVNITWLCTEGTQKAVEGVEAQLGDKSLVIMYKVVHKGRTEYTMTDNVMKFYLPLSVGSQVTNNINKVFTE